jgi:ABC-2 type transport system permease protein
MSKFYSLVHHEFLMSIRRPGLWIAYGMIFLFFVVALFLPQLSGRTPEQEIILMSELWKYAGRYAIQFNLFLPVVGGILAADRMQRDFRLGVRELQTSAPLSRPAYILGKYFGVLASLLLPVFLWVLAVAAGMAVGGNAPWAMIYALPVAFLAMIAPAFAFVTAFSLACPLIMPLRVYQILFTGYWFWGNFLTPQAFPTISETLLSAGGKFALQGYFGGGFPSADPGVRSYTALDATLNLVVLGLCIICALYLLNTYLRWQAQRA